MFLFRSHYQRARDRYRRYERLLMPLMLVVGFFTDYFTFKNIQVRTSLTVLACYFVIAGASIAFTRYYDAGYIVGRGRVSKLLKYIRLFVPLAIQYTFGALLGATFVFYWFSASLAASWPFIVLIAILMVSNEALRKQVQSGATQLVLYYGITFSFFSIATPYVFNTLSSRMFVYTGLGSLLYGCVYLWLVARATKETRAQLRGMFAWVFGIFVVMNMLYFSNIIPPIPLSLRDAGAYHSVARANGGYALLAEQESFWQRLWPGKTIRITPGSPVYVYTAIFAPSDLRIRIYHRWQQYDEAQSEWVTRDRLSFAITGGRTEGYRGYSLKRAVDAGRWRVVAETERGQVLGRVTFHVESVAQELGLKKIIVP